MKVKKKERQNIQGFTLVELLVAMAVSLLAIGAIYSTFLNQFKSYQVQEEVAAMQQNIRVAMFHLQREIRMAGCDPTGLAGAGIIAASASSIHFTEDVWDGNPDGSPDGDTGDNNEDITYNLDDSDGDGVVDELDRNNQTVAENIDALNFVYLDANGNTTTTPENIRSVEITIVARTGEDLRASPNNVGYYNQQGTQILGAKNDHYTRKCLTAVINCRNLGLN
jgi:type IV pilus assembly protein PilW